jgi:hypothetical protein
MSNAVAITIQALLADGGVSYVVGDRIWPNKAQQGNSDPHIVVSLISEDEPVLLEGSSCITTSRVRIDCRASTSTQAMSLGEDVKTALRDKVGVTILSKTVSFMKGVSDTTGYSDDPDIEHRTLDFYVEWR